ncbi:MAG: ribonuclease R [Bacteroidota bacterium]
MSKKKKKIKGKRLTARQLQVEIIKLFSKNPRKRFNAKQVIKKLRVSNNKDSVQYAMEKLTEQQKLRPLPEGKFKIHHANPNSHTRNIETGIVSMTRSGAAYIVVDGLEQDIHVAARRTNNALHGDKVKVSTWTPRGRYKPEGEIIAVLERARAHFIGTLRVTRQYGIVILEGDNMPADIMVNHDDMKDAREGDKVVVEVTRWPAKHNHSFVGKIRSVLGAEGSSDIEMKSILVNNGFELEFPEAVLKESEQMNATITAEDLALRRDMREVPTFTIDPVDAKDFDDALSLEYLEDGNYEIGVHIADVTHFLQADTALDKEAYQRSTSVYLVDRVLPMLPEKLSNELCSLRPDEDKFTFSAVFTFNKNDKIIKRWFGKTLTHSNHRFTYQSAQEVLNKGEGVLAAELKKLNLLAKKMRKQRFKSGSVDFNSEEVRFILDEEGVPTDVYVKERRDTNMLIEEYMLLANKEVAAYISKKGKSAEIPYVYRVHDEPDPDKVADLVRFAREMGVKIHAETPEQTAKAYNKLAKQALTDSNLKVLEPLAIRTMAKAEYSTDNIGHYGLGFEFYSHFTSPIRRYSDVLAHRILYQNLDGKTKRVNKDQLEARCKHISRQERRANDAERESVKYKQVEFMKKRIGEVFEGQISGIIDRGIFVETLRSRCEGMISFDRIWESFEVDRGKLSVRGKRTGRIYKMGDRVKICIVGADLRRRRIEMEFVED